MKTKLGIYLIINILILQNIFHSYGQTVLTLQPGSDIGIDASLSSAYPDNNFGDVLHIYTSAWTFGGEFGIQSSLLKFDLTQIPSSAIVIDAKLSLYYWQGALPGHEGENASYLRKVIQNWGEKSVTWNNQPSTTTVGEVYLPNSSYQTQDYPDIDLTHFVSDWVADPSNNFGLLFRIANDSIYRSMLFASSDNSTASLRPKLVVTYLNCPAPVAYFSYIVQEPNVLFYDSSSSATTWFWDFGDGHSSDLKNPVHSYSQFGKYYTCLSINDSCGSSQFCDTVYYCHPPNPGFSYLVNGRFVSFSDSSTDGTQYYWDFGDGTYSTEKDPVHSFTNGIFHVCHIVTNKCQQDSICKTIQIDCPNPTADFIYTIDYHAVQFTDSSSGATQYYWDFGDGTYSNEKDPVHIFEPGVFNVWHRVENACGKDSISKSIQILCPNPEAGFLYTFNYPEYQFTDTSAYGYLVSRLWDFGDGAYSTDPNPIHIYNEPGIHQVCLTVTDSCGTDTACEDINFLLPLALHIEITPVATNDLLTQFNDLTSGTLFWKWKFGDGDSSELKNPSHIYKEYGNYQVCLTAGNTTSLGTTCETLLLSVNPSLHTSNPMLVYPNPTDGTLFLRFYRTCSSTEVLVEEQSGKRVFFQYLSSPDLMTPSQIDLTGLAAGLYFVRVKCDEYNKVWKIVIINE